MNVTFAPNQIAIVNITVVNDDTLENTEQFTAVLTIPGSMLVIGAATVTITDDDSKPYSIHIVNVTVSKCNEPQSSLYVTTQHSSIQCSDR